MRWLVVLMSVMCAASVRASVTETIDLDKRLDKKVTIEVIHTKLMDVAAELTKQTGVTIKAGTSVRDWKPREREVTIQAKDVPAGDLIKEIAHLLGFQLTTSGQEPTWTYTFWQDRKSRLAEEEAISAEAKAREEKVRSVRQGALDAADKALTMTADESKNAAPWLTYTRATASGRALATIISYFNKECPEQRDLFISGHEITLPVADLPPDIQQAIRDVAGATLGRLYRSPDEQPADITDLTITPTTEDEMIYMAGDISFRSVGKMPALDEDGNAYEQQYDQNVADMPLVSPDSAMGRLMGEFALAVEAGRDPEELQEEFDPKLETAEFVADILDRESATEKNPPTDPELTREIEIKEFPEEVGRSFEPVCSPDEAGMVLKEIARATGWSVLFESFRDLNAFSLFIVPGKQPLYRVLIALEKGGYLWERGQGTLRIRPDDWLVRRAPEISEALIAQYKRLYEKKGRVTLDDLAWLVSSLTDTQLVRGLDSTDIAGLVDWEACDGEQPAVRDLLRLYRLMVPAQKAVMASEFGLHVNQLTNEQARRFRSIVALALPDASGTSILVNLAPQEDSSVTFTISVEPQTGEEPQTATYSIYLPVKEPPVEEPPPEEPPMEEEQP